MNLLEILLRLIFLNTIYFTNAYNRIFIVIYLHFSFFHVSAIWSIRYPNIRFLSVLPANFTYFFSIHLASFLRNQISYLLNFFLLFATKHEFDLSIFANINRFRKFRILSIVKVFSWIWNFYCIVWLKIFV